MQLVNRIYLNNLPGEIFTSSRDAGSVGGVLSANVPHVQHTWVAIPPSKRAIATCYAIN